MSSSSNPRAVAQRLVSHRLTERVVVAVILLNAVVLGLETSPALMASMGGILRTLDLACLVFFIIEIGIRMFALRRAYFRDPWSWFDMAIVGIALVPATHSFQVLRALRVLRVLRLITVVPEMRKVVQALLSALPGMATAVMLMGLVFYVFAVMSTMLFAASFPDWFGNLGASLYTLFQIMTLESWSMGIVRPVMESYPYAWALFVPFILLTTFAVLNLFVAIIVNAMTAEESGAAHDERDAILAELKAVRAELRALREAGDRQA